MVNRSQVPVGVKKGEGKAPIGKGEQPMTFKRMKGRTKRPDTGKKLTKSHHTPNRNKWN